MNKAFLTRILPWMLFGFINFSQAQIPWINALPAYYHPSFTGSSEQLRLSTNNTISVDRYAFNGKQGKSFYNQNSFFVDKFIQKIHSGIGFGINYTNQWHDPGSNKERYLEGNLTIAPKLSFKGKYTISPSIQFSAAQESFNYFSYYQLPSDSISHRIKDRGRFASLKVGLMFNTTRFFVGLTYVMVNSSHYLSDKYIDSVIPLQRPVVFMIGYTFKRKPDSKFSFTPVLLLVLSRQGKGSPLNVGNRVDLFLSFKYKKAIAGIDLGANLMVGYEGKKVRVMLVQRYTSYTYQANDSYKTYTAQLSFRYLFGTSN